MFITLGDLAKGTELKLYNTSGHATKQIPVLPYKKEYEIDVSGLPAGLYVVVLLDNGKLIDKEKVIIGR